MWGSSHSHLSVICFLKSCAVTLTNQPLGLFRCCVSSEETESYALPLNPSTPSAQFISTNPQQHCFTTTFNLNKFQNHFKTVYKRPVTTTATNPKPAKKSLQTCKSDEIYHQHYKILLTNPQIQLNHVKTTSNPPLISTFKIPPTLSSISQPLKQHTQTSKRPVNIIKIHLQAALWIIPLYIIVNTHIGIGTHYCFQRLINPITSEPAA